MEFKESCECDCGDFCYYMILDRQGNHMEFNEAGRLIKLVRANGGSMCLSYTNGKLTGVFEGENPYEPADMQMGLEEIHISEVYVRESLLTEGEQLLYVAGQNFTEWSKVYINMEEAETIFLTDRLLAARNLPESKTGVYYIKVAQQGADDIILSETEAIEFYPE